MMTSEAVHKAGAHRHKDRWLHANSRAVEAASYAGIDYRDDKTKIAIALIVLKVLDGQMVDTGFSWNVEAGKWIPRRAELVADRLMGATM